MNHYFKMFCIVSEVANKQNEQTPLPFHESTFKKWNLTMNQSLQKISEVLNLEKSEKQSLDKVESLFYKMILDFDKKAKYYTLRVEKVKVLQHIFEKHQVAQRSEKWYLDTQHMLTASEFSSLFESPRTRGQLVLSKVRDESKKYSNVLAKPTEYLTAMDWGIRFEPIIRSHLEDNWKCKIYESGRLKHDTNTHLGASPDGIIIECEDDNRFGRLVEIKCPYSREIGKAVPFEYWCQMQIQMEVTNLNECEYVEVEILSVSPKNPVISFESLDINKSIGTIYLLGKEDSYTYAYSEAVKTILEEKDGFELKETIQYQIKKLHNVLVKRDKLWYESTKPLQKEFWEDVEKAKNGTFVLPESSKKRKTECLIQDIE